MKELSEAERGFLTNFCDMDLQGAEGALGHQHMHLKKPKAIDGADDLIDLSAELSPEDAKKYLEFLENGSTAGLTPEELAGIEKLDELLALEKVSSWESIGKKVV